MDEEDDSPLVKMALDIFEKFCEDNHLSAGLNIAEDGNSVSISFWLGEDYVLNLERA